MPRTPQYVKIQAGRRKNLQTQLNTIQYFFFMINKNSWIHEKYHISQLFSLPAPVQLAENKLIERKNVVLVSQQSFVQYFD